MISLVGEKGALLLFLLFLTLSAAAMAAAWSQGRRWGDLSSRVHNGETLDRGEELLLRRCRRGFFLRGALSLLFLALSFFALR